MQLSYLTWISESFLIKNIWIFKKRCMGIVGRKYLHVTFSSKTGFWILVSAIGRMVHLKCPCPCCQEFHDQPLSLPSQELVQAVHTRYQRDGVPAYAERRDIQTKSIPHARTVLNPHKLHRDTPTYKEPSKITVDNCFSTQRVTENKCKQNKEAEEPLPVKRPRESPWRNKETDFLNLIYTEFEKEVMKILKELRKTININTDCCEKEPETMRRSQEKLENSFAEMKAELKAMISRMNIVSPLHMNHWVVNFQRGERVFHQC